MSLVLTTPTGGLVLRQTISKVVKQAASKVVKQAAKTANITADLGTHAGRRTVVTTLFVGGHRAPRRARPADTTAGYVKRLGRRPEAVAKRAAVVLDGQGDEDAADPQGVRNDPPNLASSRGCNRPARASEPPDAVGQ